MAAFAGSQRITQEKMKKLPDRGDRLGFMCVEEAGEFAELNARGGSTVPVGQLVATARIVHPVVTVTAEQLEANPAAVWAPQVFTRPVVPVPLPSALAGPVANGVPSSQGMAPTVSSVAVTPTPGAIHPPNSFPQPEVKVSTSGEAVSVVSVDVAIGQPKH